MKLPILALIPVVAFFSAAAAQTSAPVSFDEAKRVALHGSVNLLAQPRFDRGAVADEFPVQRALVMLQPSPEREAALQSFLREAHSPDSASYHQWLTPEQYGARFGATDDDIATVTSWLQASGFTVARVTKSKTVLEFSGTAAQVRSALHAEIHQYEAGGKSFYANDREITVPAAIASRIRNFAPLNSIVPDSYVSVTGRGRLVPGTHRVTAITPNAAIGTAGAKPEFTTTANNGPFYALAPEDFATQYDLGPLYTAGTKGDGQTIGVIGEANLNLALVDAYRALFNLPADHTNVIVDGEDPGVGEGPDIEGFLDVETSGAVAPNAAVNYYIASGQPLQDPLALAALRAIDDNEASVLSVSYGECEQLLGTAGNQLWNGLWQQAAAQGQTVLVASGDSGPNACPEAEFDTTPPMDVFLGPSVSGLTSTPWNISVGGTDFSYTDYLTGGASIAALWNQTNDAGLGSLKAPLPEQPWDNEFGLNIVPPPSHTEYLGASGGGGSSNCSNVDAGDSTTVPTCVSGYVKPAWQQGTGVPADSLRDIPDVSLFAANGLNLTAWPICAEGGDCASGASSAITLVGGTSSSTPAMAGIMALVNQKYGRQGQANYTLYALAQQAAAAFHDVTVGTNDTICYPEYAGCTMTEPAREGNVSVEVSAFGFYNATTGYDLASGLGSVDANQLLANWTKVTTTATATTLQLSAATVAHGSPIGVTATVKPSSGSGVPTGAVVLQTSPAMPLRGNGALTLSGGTVTANVATLPGGTYNVVAQYSGDGVFGASTSSPVALTVSPEASTTALTVKCSRITAEGVSTTFVSPAQAQYGDACTFIATPAGQSAASTGLATGSVTFTDGSTTATLPLNVNGVATWTPQTFALGAHTITASYSGDASYSASTATPYALSVIKGTPVLVVSPLDFPNIFNCQQDCIDAYLAGSSFAVHVLLETEAGNIAPTGTLTLSLGALSQTVPLNENMLVNESIATANATLANVPAGTFTLTASYPGDTNYNAASYTDPQQYIFEAGPSVTTTTTLTATPSTAGSDATITFNATVTASSNQVAFPDFSLITLLANGTRFYTIEMINNDGVPSSTQSGTVQIPATALGQGAQQIVAVYSGGLSIGIPSTGVGNGPVYTAFAPSTSAPVTVNVSNSEFTLASGVTNIGVAAGKTVSVPLLLGTGYGLTAPVSLTCSPSSSTFTCSLSASSVSVSGSATAMVTIDAFTTPAAVASAPGERPWWFAAKGIVALSCLVLLGISGRRRRWPMLRLLAFVCAMASGMSLIGCGGHGPASAPVGPAPPSNPVVVSTPTGTYSVVVEGVSGEVTHSVKVDVVVQ